MRIIFTRVFKRARNLRLIQIRFGHETLESATRREAFARWILERARKGSEVFSREREFQDLIEI